MNNDLAAEMLRNIATAGGASTTAKAIIASQSAGLSHVLNTSSGSPKLHNSIVKKFKLILSMPDYGWNPFEVRCCLCKRVISYPCWYYAIKYSVNQFHYFICFDSDSKDKPTVKCYRRDV